MNRCSFVFESSNAEPRRCAHPTYGTSTASKASTESNTSTASTASASPTSPTSPTSSAAGSERAVDRCIFHLSPAERAARDVTVADVRRAFLDELDAGDDERKRFDAVHLGTFDLSSLVLDADDLGTVVFRELEVDGMLDFSGTTVRHPLVVHDCTVGELRTTGATFERELYVEESVVGRGRGTAAALRRTEFRRSAHVDRTRFRGSVDASTVESVDWFRVENVAVEGRLTLRDATLARAQLLDVDADEGIDLRGATVTQSVELLDAAGPLDLAGATISKLDVRPAGESNTDDAGAESNADAGTDVSVAGASLSRGRLSQPTTGRARYDLTDATLGRIDLDCVAPADFDRYRFCRTEFDGFQFTTYREFFRARDWRLHADDLSTADCELTYLRAKQGASAVGDNDDASEFFVREMRCRRRRYREQAADGDRTVSDRAAGALRWLTNALLAMTAGYGERPQRVVGAALVVILGCTLVYPALGGLETGTSELSYAASGASALGDSLYFSVVTFTTLGYGDIHPVGVVRLLAAGEAVTGAFLTALFVFALGRRVTR